MTSFDAALGITSAEADQKDVARHVLGNLILPRTEQDINAAFAQARKDGATLPEGEPGRFHADVADVRKTLDKLVKLGLAKLLTGYDSFAKMIEDADGDDALVDNNQDPGDTPHAPDRTVTAPDGSQQVIKAYYQTDTRGGLWAINQELKGADPSANHWVMTRDGFRALTGHEQGANPALTAPATPEQEDA